MSNEVIFWTQIASILAFIFAVFGLYKSHPISVKLRKLLPTPIRLQRVGPEVEEPR